VLGLGPGQMSTTAVFEGSDRCPGRAYVLEGALVPHSASSADRTAAGALAGVPRYDDVVGRLSIMPDLFAAVGRVRDPAR